MPYVTPGTGASSGPTQRATLTRTAAQVRSLFTDSPITLVAAPGSGQMIVPARVMFVYTFGTHPFFSGSGSGTNAQIKVGATALVLGASSTSSPLYGSSVALCDITVSSDPLLNQSASAVLDLSGIPLSSVATSQGPATPAVLNGALTLTATNADLTYGQYVTGTIQAAGAGYAVNDTLADDGTWGAADLLVTVNTISAGGHVTAFTVTNVGTAGWHVGNGGPNVGESITFNNVPPQSGAGSGFEVKVASINLGDGTLQVITDYEVVTF